jgi:hypothetical protein
MPMSEGVAAAGKRQLWPGDDFPSWLSPMIVKELRQGVQSGAFAWTFIGLQGAMFLLMSFALTLVERGVTPSSDFVHTLFWMIVGVGVLLVVPLRGMGAISSERIGNNLDLVRLTRLSATRIVIGKWLAIVAQAALLVVAILPYVVLRYFFGGVNVIRDLEVVAWLLAGSMVVAAAALALSTQPLAARIGAGAGAWPLTVVILQALGLRGFGTWGSAERLAVLAALVVYTVALLEYAASRIAPVAENHALRKRVLALFVAIAWFAVAVRGSQGATQAMAFLALPLVLMTAIEAVLERPVHLRSQAAAFVRYGLPGRCAARLLTPGWATGLLFTVVLAVVCGSAWWIAAARFKPSAGSTAALASATALFAAVLSPLPFLVYLPRVRYRFLPYALIQLLCFMAFVYAHAMKPPVLAWKAWPLGWRALLPLPLASLASLVASEGSRQVAGPVIVASGIVAAVVCVAVLPPWLREMREGERVLDAARTWRSGRTLPGRPGAPA